MKTGFELPEIENMHLYNIKGTFQNADIIV